MLAAPPAGSDCVTGSGDIQGLRLPTLGRIEWTYQTYKFPQTNSPWRTKTQGVATRTTKNEQGAVLGQWTYATSLTPNPNPGQPEQELINSVTNPLPLGQRTNQYFSVALDNSLSGWSWCDYGQPFTRYVSTGGASPLYLSAQSFRTSGALFKSEYVRYERDQAGTCDGGPATLDHRVAKSITSYADDGAVYAETDYSSFDGLGHYRSATTAGTFPTGNVRAHFTNFNPTHGTYTVDPDTNVISGNFTPLLPSDKWILGTSSYQFDQENGVTGSYVESCYDGQTGFLLRKGAHAVTGTGVSGADAVTVYVPTTQGNVASERSYGGDVQQGIGLGNVCSASPGAGLPSAPEYEIDHGYTSFGALATSQYLGASFFSLNQQVDPSMGVVRSSTDTTGMLTTTYSYDSMGRVTRVQPPQGAATVYTYIPADPGTKALANVDIVRQGPSGASLAHQQLVFDALGRVYHETQQLADSTYNVRETLYDKAGHKASISELQAGNPLKTTQFLNFDPDGRAQAIQPADSLPPGNLHNVTIANGGAQTVTRTVTVGTTLAGGVVSESPATTTERYDRQGRLYQVTEPSGTGGANVTTTYGYDVGNRLSAVSTTSAGVTQTRSFNYDQRGFLLSETHPEKGTAGNGTVSYSLYDSRGHVGRKVDGPSIDLTYKYDFAERLLLVRETGPNFTACSQLSGPKCLKLFSYAVQNGTGDYKNGKLFQSIRYNYPLLGGIPYQAFITHTYHYGGVDGRVSQRDTLLTFALSGQPTTPSSSFTVSFAYDLLGNTSSITYPTCTFTECVGKDVPRTVNFNHTNGFLTSVAPTAVIPYPSSVT
jgi:hypothetical protein